MLNPSKHKLHMGRILIALYGSPQLAPLLGFKGGTCAYLFYGLSRISVDLDFDWLGEGMSDYSEVFKQITDVVKKEPGFEIKDSYIKKYTLFWSLSYGTYDHNIKIEINIRSYGTNVRQYYEMAEFQGTPVLIAKRPYMFANKLIALTDRRKMATRDIYDVWFFINQNWDIDQDSIRKRAGKNLSEQIEVCIQKIENVHENEILAGLGELLTNSKKDWARKNLIKQTVSLLKNYAAAFGTK